jgi:hypothetical protein
VSNPEHVTSRLSDAIDDILKGAPKLPEREGEAPTEPPTQPAHAASIDDPYELPQIVEATAEVPVLPDRSRASRPPVPPPPPPPRATAPVAPAPATAVVAAAVAPASATYTPKTAAPVPTTSWSDHIPQTTTASGTGAALRAPGRRPRVRRVTRVVRHIDPWSTFKLALVFSVLLYGILLTAGVLIWNVALNTGTVDNVERWFTQFGWDTFEMKGGEIYHNAWVGGLFGVVALTGFAVLAVTLFNLVSDMIGGIRMTVLEEEVVERTVTPGRKFVVRRPPVDDETAGTFDLDGDLPAPAVVDSSAPTTSATSAPATTTASTSTAPTPADEPSRAVEESPT